MYTVALLVFIVHTFCDLSETSCLNKRYIEK